MNETKDLMAVATVVRVSGSAPRPVGSRTAEEVAIAILAEMTTARYGRGGELHGRVRRLERDV